MNPTKPNLKLLQGGQANITPTTPNRKTARRATIEQLTPYLALLAVTAMFGGAALKKNDTYPAYSSSAPLGRNIPAIPTPNTETGRVEESEAFVAPPLADVKHVVVPNIKNKVTPRELISQVNPIGLDALPGVVEAEVEDIKAQAPHFTSGGDIQPGQSISVPVVTPEENPGDFGPIQPVAK